MNFLLSGLSKILKIFPKKVKFLNKIIFIIIIDINVISII